QMGLSLNVEDGQKIVVPFTIKNVLDILDLLSIKDANVYSDLFIAFRQSVSTAFAEKEDRTESEYLILNKLNALNDNKARQLVQDYENGINILRLEHQAALPS